MPRILVLDDDVDILKMAKQVLSSAHYEVFTEKSVPQATDRLKLFSFDLIISDVKMPYFSGFDFAQSLKKNKKFESIPIIMLTGLREAKDVKKALRVGADDYIVKPFDPLLLLKKVEHILGRKALSSEKTNVEFSKARLVADAKIIFPAKILFLSEEEIELQCSQSFEEGQIVQVQTPLFNEVGFSVPPKLRVFSSDYLKKDKMWKINCSFFALDESSLQKIRAWIYSQQMKLGASKVSYEVK